MRTAMVLGVLGLAGTLASPAFAKDEFTGLRITALAGSETMNGKLSSAALGATEDADANRFTYGIGLGWALNKYVAVELGLRGGSEYNTSQFETVEVAPEDYVASHLDLGGFEASIVGSWWFNDHLSIYGRAGMFAWDATELYTVGNDATPIRPASKIVHKAGDTGVDPMFGVGFQTVLDGALMRVEYRYTEIGNLQKPGVFLLGSNKFSSLEFSIVWTL